eukprot:441518_1
MAQQVDSDVKNDDFDQNLITAITREKEGGYKISLFVKHNKATRYQCGLCTQVCCEAVESSCYACDEDDNDDKQYCKSCLRMHLNQNNFTCPIDKEHKNVSYTDCKYIRDKVNNLSIYCPTSNHDNVDGAEGNQIQVTKGQNYDEKQDENKDSCDWKGKLHQLFDHLNNECKFYEKPMKCEYWKYGCTFIAGSKLLQKHNEQDMVSHMNLLCNIVDELRSENKKLWNAIDELKRNAINDAMDKKEKELDNAELNMNTIEAIVDKITRSNIELNTDTYASQTHQTSVPTGQHSVSPLSAGAGGQTSAPMLEINPLTSEMLQDAKPAEKKRLIGERLFPKIQVVEPRLAGKITGMLLEM